MLPEGFILMQELLLETFILFYCTFYFLSLLILKKMRARTFYFPMTTFNAKGGGGGNIAWFVHRIFKFSDYVTSLKNIFRDILQW